VLVVNIDPNTGQKLTSTGESGNGLKDAIVKREREKREIAVKLDLTLAKVDELLKVVEEPEQAIVSTGGRA